MTGRTPIEVNLHRMNAREPDLERIVDLLSGELSGDADDDSLVERLARGCAVETLPAGGALTISRTDADADGNDDADVRFLLDGLVVLRVADESEPPAAVAAGGAFAPGGGVEIVAAAPATLLTLDAATWRAAVGESGPEFGAWRDALGVSYPVGAALDVPPVAPPDTSPGAAAEGSPLRMPVASLMSAEPVVAAPTLSIREAAASMCDGRLSCLPLVDGETLVGIVTESDMTVRAVAAAHPIDAPVGAIMTPDPLSIDAAESVFDLLALMARRQVSHLPVKRAGKVVGIVTHGDIVRRQSTSPVFLVERVARLDSSLAIAAATADVPRLLADLVEAGGDAVAVGNLVTAVTDAVTRRLIVLAQDALGPAPCRFAWLACGSQGRREQSGATDQDNALLLDDAFDEDVHGEWFGAFASFVCDGLETAGYPYCPGEMMATTPRWRQPVQRWRRHFDGWIAQPGGEARLLASVMFDLRVIDGEESLFVPLQREVLDGAAANGIFVAHMVASALTHRPPIGPFNRLARARRGAFRGRIDLKHGGIAPIVDLARLHALASALPAVGTVERLRHAAEHGSGVLSAAGARDLLDVWETVSSIRLAHQARQVRRGEAPDNHVDPGALSRLERERLRDALLAVRDIQSALGARHATIGA